MIKKNEKSCIYKKINKFNNTFAKHLLELYI